MESLLPMKLCISFKKLQLLSGLKVTYTCLYPLTYHLIVLTFVFLTRCKILKVRDFYRLLKVWHLTKCPRHKIYSINLKLTWDTQWTHILVEEITCQQTIEIGRSLFCKITIEGGRSSSLWCQTLRKWLLRSKW